MGSRSITLPSCHDRPLEPTRCASVIFLRLSVGVICEICRMTSNDKRGVVN
ncbi:hypothetical protein C4J85_5258 [Pseudomonas sp. R4-34-07]|nr:hypothetical protein C4J85_5258 [Pseudomonas sp. R4-34-07]